MPSPYCPDPIPISMELIQDGEKYSILEMPGKCIYMYMYIMCRQLHVHVLVNVHVHVYAQYTCVYILHTVDMP